jgi:Domain of unknown function (DUF4350)
LNFGRRQFSRKSPAFVKPLGRFTIDALWLAAILVVGSMQFWFPNVRPGISHDSYSTEADGKKAFYLLMRQEAEKRGIHVARGFQPLDQQVAGSPARNMPSRLNLKEPPALCLLGPERYPRLDEWNAILKWVQAGGSLVVAARDDHPKLTLKPLNIAVKPLSELDEAHEEEDDSGLVRTTLVDEGNLYWETSGWIDAPQAQPLVQFGGTVQAVVQEHGYGRVIVVATDFPFSNQSLAWQDNSVLAFALLLARPSNPIQPQPRTARIVLDESLNATGIPQVIGVLLDPRLRPLTIQLATLGLVFAWWKSRRFGPLLPPAVPPRRNIVDHTDALGVHAYRTKDAAGMLRAYLHQLRMELKLQGPSANEDRVLEPLARRLNRSPEFLKTFLEHAEQAATAKRLKRRHAAEFIRRLAILRAAASAKDAAS